MAMEPRSSTALDNAVTEYVAEVRKFAGESIARYEYAVNTTLELVQVLDSIKQTPHKSDVQATECDCHSSGPVLTEQHSADAGRYLGMVNTTTFPTVSDSANEPSLSDCTPDGDKTGGKSGGLPERHFIGGMRKGQSEYLAAHREDTFPRR